MDLIDPKEALPSDVNETKEGGLSFLVEAANQCEVSSMVQRSPLALSSRTGVTLPPIEVHHSVLSEVLGIPGGGDMESLSFESPRPSGQVSHNMRKGRWTTYEEKQAEHLIAEYRDGKIKLRHGMSLRRYLAEALNCDPMRISKKFPCLKAFKVCASAAESPKRDYSLKSIMNERPGKPGKKLIRQGRWTSEEEQYAKAIMHAFKNGYLPLPGSTSLRKLLSEVLLCPPMRLLDLETAGMSKAQWHHNTHVLIDVEGKRRNLWDEQPPVDKGDGTKPSPIEIAARKLIQTVLRRFPLDQSDIPEPMQSLAPIGIEISSVTKRSSIAFSKLSSGYLAFRGQLWTEQPDLECHEELWLSQSTLTKSEFESRADYIHALMTSIAHGLESLDQIGRIKATLKSQIGKVPHEIETRLAIEPCTTELKHLKKALGDNFDPYVRELADLMRTLRQTADRDLDGIDHEFSRAYNGYMDSTEFLKVISQISTLEDRQLSLLATHFDHRGNRQIDIKHFFQWLHSVIPSRQCIIEQAFKSLQSKGSKGVHLRRILAKVEDQRHDIWFSERQDVDGMVQLRDWIDFYTVFSDEIPRDFEFARYFYDVWEVKTASSVLQKVKDGMASLQQLSRMKNLLLEIEKIEEKVAIKSNEINQKAKDMMYLPLNGKSFSYSSKPSVKNVIFSYIEHVQCIHLANSALNILPDSIQQLTKLTYLDISSNTVSQLPQGIGELIHLQILHAERNSLCASSFPDSFGRLRAMKKLFLSFNSIEMIPKVFSGLEQLTELNLDHNKVQYISSGVSLGLSNLKFLRLSDNYLTTLNEEIRYLLSLELLELHQNSLTRLPLGLGELSQLKSISLNNNKLSDAVNFPDVSSLTELSQFSLWHNKIDRIPSSIGTLSSLIKLALPLNKIRSIRDVPFEKLVSCTEIDLHANELSEIPNRLFRIPHLSVCKLYANAIQRLPQEMEIATKLKVLQLQNNRIRTIPDCLGKMKSLLTLYLDNNRIQDLPASFAGLMRESTLHFGSLRDSETRSVLQDLRLDGNPLTPELKQIIAKGYYETALSKRYNMALVKLIDGMSEKAKVFAESDDAARDFKHRGIRPRKGRARHVTRVLDLKFSRLRRNQEGYVPTDVFREALFDLGIAWSPGEIRAVTKCCSIVANGELTNDIDLNGFLRSIETFHGEKRKLNTALAVLKYLKEVGNTAVKPIPIRPSTAPRMYSRISTETKEKIVLKKRQGLKKKNNREQVVKVDRMEMALKVQRDRVNQLKEQLDDPAFQPK